MLQSFRHDMYQGALLVFGFGCYLSARSAVGHRYLMATQELDSPYFLGERGRVARKGCFEVTSGIKWAGSN